MKEQPKSRDPKTDFEIIDDGDGGSDIILHHAGGSFTDIGKVYDSVKSRTAADVLVQNANDYRKSFEKAIPPDHFEAYEKLDKAGIFNGMTGMEIWNHAVLWADRNQAPKISRVGGEPPKPEPMGDDRSEVEKQREQYRLAAGGSNQETAYEYNPNGKWEDCSKQDYELWHEKYPENYRKKLIEKLSGEAKTPDQYTKEKLEEVTNAGDLFGGLSGHEVEPLKKCGICYDLADKYFGEGADEDGGTKMHAVDFAHFVIGQVKLVNELTGGSVPTPSDEKGIMGENIIQRQAKRIEELERYIIDNPSKK